MAQAWSIEVGACKSETWNSHSCGHAREERASLPREGEKPEKAQRVVPKVELASSSFWRDPGSDGGR